MSWTPAQIALWTVGFLHLAFMAGEWFPPKSPMILRMVLKKWPRRLDLSADETQFVSSVVYNAGLYNGIVGLALFVAASVGPAALPVQIALLAGGIAAGLFGAATLTKGTIVQAFVGLIAMVVVLRFRV